MNETKYSTRGGAREEHMEFDTLREAEDEARELAQYGDVQVVKISVVGVYKKKIKR